MRRQSMKRLVWLLSAVLLVSIGLVASAQEPAGKAPPKAASPQALPLTEVVLYSSGVGYFQRDGSIEGRGDVELRFKVDNINDLLKSMIVQDFDGGQVTTVTYDSRDPITKTLKSFAADLTTHPGLGQLLEQIRGERSEGGAAGPPLRRGWAIVKNPTAEDGEKGKLPLISGRPISFRMDLYEPLYVKRPV